MNTLLYYGLFIVWSAVDLFCVYFIMCTFLGLKRKQTPPYLFVLVLVYLALTLVYAYANITDIPVFIVLTFFPYYLKVFVIMATLFQKRNYITIVWYIIIFEFILNIIVQTVMFAFRLDTEGSDIASIQITNALSILIGMIALIVLFLLDRQMIGKNLSDYTSIIPERVYIIVVLSLFCVGLLESVLFGKETIITINLKLSRLLTIFLILLLVLLIGHLLIINKSKVFSEKIAEILSQQVESLVNQYEEINKQDEELRRFKHDSKNLLLCLKAMLEVNDVEQSIRYIENMSDSFLITENRYDCGNYIIDALMNSKNGAASKYNTIIEFDGFVPTGRITNFDLCIIFTNALDNAIEACEGLPGEKVIHIESNIANGFWFLRIENPVKGNINIYKNSIETTKKDKELHGYGLKNMERVGKKYNGTLTLTCENNIFIFEAALQLIS